MAKIRIISTPNSFKEGGGIHIDPENKGKFNETKRRTGKTTEELTHSSNPLTRKRAIFAQNAAKWKHHDGGNLFADAGEIDKSNSYQLPFQGNATWGGFPLRNAYSTNTQGKSPLTSNSYLAIDTTGHAYYKEPNTDFWLPTVQTAKYYNLPISNGTYSGPTIKEQPVGTQLVLPGDKYYTEGSGDSELTFPENAYDWNSYKARETYENGEIVPAAQTIGLGLNLPGQTDYSLAEQYHSDDYKTIGRQEQVDANWEQAGNAVERVFAPLMPTNYYRAARSVISPETDWDAPVVPGNEWLDPVIDLVLPIAAPKIAEGAGTVLKEGVSLAEDAAKYARNTYYKPWKLSREIDNAELRINPNSRLYTTTSAENRVGPIYDSGTRWDYNAYTSDGYPVGKGQLYSSLEGNGTHIGWIENTSKGKEHGASRTIYNAMVQDSRGIGEPGAISGENLFSPEITESVTADFPHAVIGEGDWAYPLSGANPYRPEERLLTGTNGEVPRYTDPSIIDRHQWFPEEQASRSMVFDGTVYPPEQLKRVWKDNRYQWEPVTNEDTANWLDWTNRMKDPTEADIDDVYMKAVQEGDIETAQALRDQHFIDSAPNSVLIDENGNPIQLYHGTNSSFTEFDLNRFGQTDGGTAGKGIYLTPDDQYASHYGNNVMPLYAKLEHPYDLTPYSANDILHAKRTFGQDFAHVDNIGYSTDGAIVDPLGQFTGKIGYGTPEYTVFDPAQIKSADAVTYFKADDPEVLSGQFRAGDPIPLNMRDNFNRNDIRFGWLPWISTIGTGIGLGTTVQTNQ